MSIILTADTIAQITETITNEASSIDYNADVDASAMARCAVLAWERIVEMEFQYIDSVQEKDEMKEILLKAGINLQEVIEDNDDFVVESFWFEHEKATSVNEFKKLVELVILSDLGSAWVDLIRETIQDIFNEDPLGNNDGLQFTK